MTPRIKITPVKPSQRMCHCGKMGIYSSWGVYFCSDHRHQAQGVIRPPKPAGGYYGKKTKWLPAKQFADRMRRKPTQAEELFLNALLAVFQGYTTRPASQVPIGPYVVDFKVNHQIIEVDGYSHSLHKEHDQRRTSFLVNRGFRILRLTNAQIYQDAKHWAQVVFKQTAPHKPGKPKIDASDYFAI